MGPTSVPTPRRDHAGVCSLDYIMAPLPDGCGVKQPLLRSSSRPNNFIEFGIDWCFLEVQEPPPPEFVPEPGSVLLLAGGLMGLAGYAGLQARKR